MTNLDSIIPEKQARKILGICGMTLWRLWHEMDGRPARLPPPLKLNNRSFWRESTLQAFLDGLQPASAEAVAADRQRVENSLGKVAERKRAARAEREHAAA